MKRLTALPLLVALCSPALAVTLDVPAEFDTIEAAIGSAKAGDIVLVAPGLYEITRPISFEGKDIILRSSEGPEVTTIRMAAVPENPERASVVIFENGESEAAILEGLTLTGGKGYRWGSETFQRRAGGGIYCQGGARPKITNCVISQNSVIGVGGGVFCTQGAHPEISDSSILLNTAELAGGGIGCLGAAPVVSRCTISRNSSGGPGADFGQGGGIFCGFLSSPLIEDCTITSNSSEGGGTGGGGIACEADSSPTISGCRIRLNASTGGPFDGTGGGIVCKSGGTPTIESCTIERNYSGGTGGGIGCFEETQALITDCLVSGNASGRGGGGIHRFEGTVFVDRCRITGNDTGGNFGGGGVHCSVTESTITNCEISGNSAPFGGGILFFSDSSSMVNCLVTGNAAPSGGGIYLNTSTVEILHCTVAGNLATAPDGDMGGGIFCFNSEPALANDIFWSNLPTNIDGNSQDLTGAPREDACVEPTNTIVGEDPHIVSSGDFDFNSFQTVDIGDIEVLLPAFIKAAGDYRLQEDSPAIDQGAADFAPAADLFGAARICGEAPDIGAYEFLTEDCRPRFRRGDANVDGKLDISDPIAVLNHLFAGEQEILCGDAADGNDDNKIDISDAILALNFLFGGQETLIPAPGPDDCGADPSTSDLAFCQYESC